MLMAIRLIWSTLMESVRGRQALIGRSMRHWRIFLTPALIGGHHHPQDPVEIVLAHCHQFFPNLCLAPRAEQMIRTMRRHQVFIRVYVRVNKYNVI